MAKLDQLVRKAGMSGERRGGMFSFAKSRRREWLRCGYSGEVANRRTYEAILRRLLPEEERNIKHHMARQRRNAGTYPRRRQPRLSVSPS